MNHMNFSQPATVQRQQNNQDSRCWARQYLGTIYSASGYKPKSGCKDVSELAERKTCTFHHPKYRI